MSLDPDYEENRTFDAEVFEPEEDMNPEEQAQSNGKNEEQSREYEQVQEDQIWDKKGGNDKDWIPAEYDDELEEELWFYTAD